MKLTIRLARRGQKYVRPNPLVGAVVVKNNRIVGQGYHHRLGAEHAEILALKYAGAKTRGAILYVNLEPCSHYGQTPPCTKAIISAGIKRVVLATEDPNPLIAGRGIKELKAAGIEVLSGVLKTEARRLNEVFFKFITTEEPFTILKMASSLDGKVATRSGDSKWITSLAARKYVHRLRSRVDAVMVGVNTLRQDDPLLSPYLVLKGKAGPLKIIIDSQLRSPHSARVFEDISACPVLIATLKSKQKEKNKKIKQIEKRGGQFIFVPGRAGQINLKDLFRKLGQRGLSLIMVEGGPTLAASLLKEKLIDKVIFFIAPKIIGGEKARTSVEGCGVNRLSQALNLGCLKMRRVGEDVMVEAYPEYKVNN